MTTTRHHFQRFATLKAMAEWAATYAASRNVKVWCEAGTYEEGAAKRPQVLLVSEDGLEVVLRWNAYAEEAGIDHLGPRKAREAYMMSEHHVDAIQAAIEAAIAEDFELPAEVWAQARDMVDSMAAHASDAGHGFTVTTGHGVYACVEGTRVFWATGGALRAAEEAHDKVTRGKAIEVVARVLLGN